MKWFWSLVLLQGLCFSVDSNGSALAHRISVCETELEMVKNALSTQEQSREALEKEMTRMLKAAKEAVHDSSEQSGARQKHFDKAMERLTSDVKQLRAHGNEISAIVNDLSKTIRGIKEETASQALVIKELEQAMRGLTVAIGAKGKIDVGSVHVVRSGESLERIARQYGVSIAELKEYNNLKSSTIYPGQELLIRAK